MVIDEIKNIFKLFRTNAPYQVMEFGPNFHYPNDTISYPSHSNVLKYLHSYADKFNLKKHIKLSHLVTRVVPIENQKWELVVKNARSNTFETGIFDMVLVCNGHYSTPFIPKIRGAHEFKGKLIHSHDFRTAQAYQSKQTEKKSMLHVLCMHVLVMKKFEKIFHSSYDSLKAYMHA